MPSSVAISATTSLWCGNSSAICLDVGTVRTQASIEVIFIAATSSHDATKTVAGEEQPDADSRITFAAYSTP